MIQILSSICRDKGIQALLAQERCTLVGTGKGEQQYKTPLTSVRGDTLS